MEKVPHPEIKSTMKIIKTRITWIVAVSSRWAVGVAALKTGSMRTRKIVNMNHSGRKWIMLHCIQCIHKECHLRFYKKLRRTGWKKERGKIDCA
jgi:hypothetical protein